MNIFSPDKSTFLTHNYHYSSKLIMPSFVSSYLTSNQSNKIAKYLHFFNLCNFSFHSYFSVSTVITDYIKPKMISNIARKSNFGLHLLAFTGFTKYIIKN